MFNLPRNLRALFQFLRFLSMLSLIMLPAHFLVELALGKEFLEVRGAGGPVEVGEVSLKFSGPPLTLQSAAPAGPGAEVRMVTGHLHVDQHRMQPGEWRPLLLLKLATRLMSALWGVLLFGYLRDLCARAETGEVFSERNVETVRRLGIGLLAFGGLSLVAASVLEFWLLRGAENLHLSDEWTHLLRLDPEFGALNFSRILDQGGASLLFGALVLLLTEAFRQGLKLKTENDLTV